jgi:CBS domain-containing protein
MLVSQILKGKGSQVYTLRPTETVAAAAALLHSRRVGAMIVTDADASVVGILSERDVVSVIATQGEAGLAQSVSTVMTRDLVVATPDETVDSLMERMTDRRIRHLPVMRDGQLLGIVSIGDLVKSRINDILSEANDLKAYIAAG